MIKELVELGMTGNEAKVYVALLGLGSTSAGAIIKKTRLHRNIVYDNLEKLIGKGLVSFVVIKNTKHFEAASSKELVNLMEKQKKEILLKEKTLKDILPEIEKQRKNIRNKQEATIFNGKKGLIEVLDSTTRAKTELLIFATGWGLKETTGTYNDLWYVKLRQNKIKTKILLPESRRGRYPKQVRIKYLDEDHTIPSTICVFDDKVVNIIWEDEPTVILIVSKKVSESYKNYFEVMWKGAKK